MTELKSCTCEGEGTCDFCIQTDEWVYPIPDNVVRTNRTRPCRACGRPTVTSVPGPEPVCVLCQDAGEVP